MNDQRKNRGRQNKAPETAVETSTVPPVEDKSQDAAVPRAPRDLKATLANLPNLGKPMLVGDEKLDENFYKEWLTVTPYVPRNLLTIVTRGVKQDLFDGGFNEALKAVIEVHPFSVTGLCTGFRYSGLNNTIDSADQNVLFNLYEKYGRAVDKLMHLWQTRWNDYRRDRDLKRPANERHLAIKEEDVTIDVMWIEMDPTGTLVNEAWVGKNLRPTYYSGIESNRDVSSGPPEKVPVCFRLGDNITFGAEQRAAAQPVLDALIAAGVNPHERIQFVKAMAEVERDDA